MIRLLTILIFISTSGKSQIFIGDTTMNGIYNAQGNVLYITGKISGNVTITNAKIEANPFIQIFDTSVNIGTGCKIREFSVMWYGAVNGTANSYYAIQKSIDQCKDRFNLYFPRNTYTSDSQLVVANFNSQTKRYMQTSIRMRGDAAMWDNGSGTKIIHTGNGGAIVLQLNKGSEISNLVLEGKWQSPGGKDSVYFNIIENNYVNQGTKGNGAGLWIDPYYDGSNSGSTGCSFHDLYIKNFQYLIAISNGQGTQNGEIMTFRDIQLGNGKYGVHTSQPQEKMNTFKGVHSWGNIHTLFKINGGNYYISDVNVAGGCVQLFDISQSNWFPVSISNVYAEHFARVGRIYSSVPISINNCLFDFAYISQAGFQTLLAANSNKVKFNSCTFRYYGQSAGLKFSGNATYDNCLFSGVVAGANNSAFINYKPGLVETTGSVVITKMDTLVDNHIRMTIKSSK